MKLNFTSDRLLAVMAHPDDAELLCAGTLARAKADGAAVALCVMCAGDKGAAADVEMKTLAETRRAEADAAVALLGSELYWQASTDGELFDCPDQRRRLVEVFRAFKPTLVLAHSPEDYHPDHRAASAVAEAASWFAASRGHVIDGFPALPAPPGLWWCDTINMSGFSPEMYLDVSGHLALKQTMLACHASQLQRGAEGDFAPLAELMLRQCRMRGAQAGVAAAEAFRAHHAFKRLRAI
jgi:LmbE family N-acetylglucosaminyl deacetylase